MHRRCLVAFALLAASNDAAAADRSGVRPEVLQLPSGPGSIEGLGEAFDSSPQSGTSTFAVPLRVPPGVAGFVPSLGLHYSSGSGNGELGIGWSLGLPVVQRGTDRRLPLYDDSDVFVLRGMGGKGAEDLVVMPDGYYRFRIEGAFVRGERLGDEGWEFRNASGVKFRFGQDENSTIEDGDSIYSWCLTEQEDTVGNVIRYEYERDETGYPYLSRIVYNDFSDEIRNLIELEYEDRPDAITSYLPTYPITIARRVRNVFVSHAGRRILTYELGYTTGMGLSRLSSVELSGENGDDRLPALNMAYAELGGLDDVVTMASAPARTLGEVSEIDDVNGDALPDLLVMDPSLDGGAYSWYENLDGMGFGPRQVMTTSPSVWLDSAGVQLADMDGDGASDVVARLSSTADGFRYYPGGSATGFGESVTISPNPSFSFEDPSVRLMDLNHDRRTDWFRIDPSTGDAWVAYNEGRGSFTQAQSLGRIDPDEAISFDSGLVLADMNGDGLTDLVSVRSESLRYWPSMGFGRFDRSVELSGAPELSGSELDELQVRDLSGDGQADLVHVGVSEMRFWLNLSGKSLDSVRTLAGVPERTQTTVVRVADMNGNGTGDIVWIDSANDEAPWTYLDVLAGGAPGLLTQIDNGLGKVTTVRYGGIGEMRAWARESGIAWERFSSVGQMVVTETEIDDSLGRRYLTRYRYADALFDGAMREWRGFAYARRFDVGDDAQPTLLTNFRFDVGELEEARKGLVLATERTTEGGDLFDLVEMAYQVRSVATALDGTELRYAFERSKSTQVYELGNEPKLLESESDRDAFGNMIFEASYGEVSDADRAYGNDETVTERTFAINEEAWLVNVVATETVKSIDGTRLAEIRNYCDGEPFEGLPLGEVTRGLLTRTESWIAGDYFGIETSAEYDRWGNRVATRDGRGGMTELEYDAASHTFPVEVRRSITDEGHQLEWAADYDRAFGVVTKLTDPNGNVHEFQYDGLGRLVARIAPLDTRDHPTTTHEYHLASPISFVRTEQREISGEPGVIVHFSYVDGLGRERGTFEEAPVGSWSATGLVEYGARGQVRFASHPRWTRSADFTSAEAPEGGVLSRYDALGRIVEESENDGAVRRTVYHPLGIENWDENDTDESSERAGTPTTQWNDGLGRQRLTVELDGDREVTTAFEYDALSNLTQVTDAEGTVRRYQFDGRKRQSAVIEPNAGTWSFEYNDANDLVRRTDGQGNVVEYEYDLVGRPTKEWHRAHDGDEPRLSVEYHYDARHGKFGRLANLKGELAWLKDDAGELHFGYDARARATERVRLWEDGERHKTRIAYDAADRPSRRFFPNNTFLDYFYDERGLLKSAGGILLDATWTPWKTLERVEYGNGVVDERIHDDRLRVTRMRATAPNGNPLRDLTYTFDPASQITRIDDGRSGIEPLLDLTQDYEYDDRYRLVRATDRVASIDWQLDDVGKILSVTSGHAEPFLNVVNTYGGDGLGPDQLTRFGDERLRYDAAGRVVEDGERRLTWDAKGRLARVERGDTVEEYVYGHDDSRALKRTLVDGNQSVVRYIDDDAEERDGELVRYVMFDGGRAVKLDGREPDESGAVALRHGARFRMTDQDGLVWFLLLAVPFLAFEAKRIREGRFRPASVLRPLLASPLLLLAAMSCNGDDAKRPRGQRNVPVSIWPSNAELYLTDHLQSVVAMADGNAELARRVAYHPYGAIRATNGVSDAYDYVSNERDGVSGLGDFRARPYRHDTGSFLASDSEIILSSTGASQPPPLASFAYANANPISFADSDGLSPVRKTEICRVTDLGPVNLENLGEEVTDHERYWGPIEHSFWRIASASTAQYQGGTLRLEYPSPEFRDYGLHMSRVFGSWRPRPKVPNPVGAIAGKIRGKLEGVIDRLDEIAPRAANALSYVDVAVTLRDSAKQNAYLLADDREERRFRALVSAASQTGSSSIFSGCATCRNPGQREDYLTSQFQRLHAARAARESNRHDRIWDTNDPNRR